MACCAGLDDHLGGLLLIQGLLPAVTVYLTRELVNSLAAALESSTHVRRALLLVALMAALMLFKVLLGGVSKWVRTMQSEYDARSALTTSPHASHDAG